LLKIKFIIRNYQYPYYLNMQIHSDRHLQLQSIKIAKAFLATAY